jgi:hypothetical protein
MSILRLLPPLAVVAASLPAFAAAPPSAFPARPEPAAMHRCLPPQAFLTALDSAGLWVLKREPAGPAEKVTGVVFRESGMIDVALFKNGCLAILVQVGKARPDIEV